MVYPSTLVDNVSVYAASVGTGAITLGAAVQGYRGIEALKDGGTYSYAIRQEGIYETGRGTYLAASNVLVRSPLFSSNGNAAVNLLSNAIVSFVVLAEDIMVQTVVSPLSGYTAPPIGVGIPGDFYYNLSNPVTLYGPKTTSGWGAGVILQGNQGNPGGAGNVAIGRTQLKSLPVNYGDVWTLSEGLRSGNFLVMPANFAPPADPQEGVYITAANGKVLQRVAANKTAHICWFGAIGDGAHDGTTNPDGTPHWAGTDNTTPIQAAINLINALGGGTVYVPNGVYLVGGPFQADALSPSQILLPQFSSAVNAITISFVGESMPDEQARNTGAIIQSTLTSGPSGGGQAWLLGGSSGGQHGATWLTVAMLNIGWRIPQNSAFGCVDNFYVQATIKDRVRFDVPDGISNVGGYATQTVLQPMSPFMVGYRGPLNDIPLWDVGGTIQSFGYYFGGAPGELHNWRDYSASACWYPLLFEGQRHAGRVSRCIFTSCKNGVYIDGPLETNIDLLDIERTPASASGLAWTAPYGTDIYDPNGYWRTGVSAVTTIHIHDLDSNGNQIQPVITGGYNIRYQQVLLPNSANETYNSIFAGFGGNGGLVDATSLRETYSRTGKVPWYSNINLTTDPHGILAAFSAACPNNGHRDYRNAQIAMLNDGAIDRGIVSLQTQGAGGGMVARFDADSYGNVWLRGNGGHFLAPLGADMAGTLTLNSQSTVTVPFTRAYGAAPALVVTPTSDLGSGVRYWVTTTTTNFTLTVSSAVSAVFNYMMIGSS